MSFCKICDQRDQCQSVCPELEASLKREATYQREILFEPAAMATLVERAARGYRTWADLFPDYPWMWDRIMVGIKALPAPLLYPFLLHFYDGRNLTEVARSLNLHRGTVDQRLKKALAIVRQEIEDAEIGDSPDH